MPGPWYLNPNKPTQTRHALLFHEPSKECWSIGKEQDKDPCQSGKTKDQ